MTETAPSSLATAPQRLHPFTPIAQMGRMLPVALVLAVTVGRDFPVFGAVGAGVGLLLLIGLWSYVSWTRTTWWFDADGDLRVASGILQRTEARLQVSRLQAVDVDKPLVARLVGLAEVRPQVAGSGSGQVRLAFLGDAEAQDLRNELLARAAGVRGQSVEAVEAPEVPFVTVPSRDLAVSMLLNTGLIIGSVVAVVTLVVLLVTGNAGVLVSLLLAGAIPGVGVVQGYLAYHGFTLAESPDGLRMRSGLLNTRAQTVPPGRVHAIQVSQPILWRSRGWVQLTMNVAGVPRGDGGSGEQREARETMLLPVAPWPVARDVLARVLPGVDVEAVPLQPVPQRARRRAPFQYPRLRAGADGSVLVAHRGWLVRRTDVISHPRVQSVRVTQGPWQRALGLASMHADSVPGPVQPLAAHRDARDARALAEAEIARAHEARRTAGPERWLAPHPAAEQA